MKHLKSTPSSPTISPQLLVQALGFIVTQAVAFGLLDKGLAQTIVAIGGIVLPAAFAIATALHLGRVHAAQTVTPAPAPAPQPGPPPIAG